MANIENIRDSEKARSVWVTLGSGNEIDKIEIYLEYLAKWRGNTVRYTVKADRYRHSSGLSEWRYYVLGDSVFSHYLDEAAYNGRGGEITETARAALDKATEQMVKEYLAALDIAPAIARAIYEYGTERYKPAELIRRALVRWGKELPKHMVGALERYAEALEKVEEAKENALEVIEEVRRPVVKATA